MFLSKELYESFHKIRDSLHYNFIIFIKGVCWLEGNTSLKKKKDYFMGMNLVVVNLSWLEKHLLLEKNEQKSLEYDRQLP